MLRSWTRTQRDKPWTLNTSHVSERYVTPRCCRRHAETRQSVLQCDRANATKLSHPNREMPPQSLLILRPRSHTNHNNARICTKIYSRADKNLQVMAELYRTAVCLFIFFVAKCAAAQTVRRHIVARIMSNSGWWKFIFCLILFISTAMFQFTNYFQRGGNIHATYTINHRNISHHDLREPVAKTGTNKYTGTYKCNMYVYVIYDKV